MKVRHTLILFFCSFLTLVTQQVWGQDLPSTCGGSQVRYGVSGLPLSVFNWEVTGGTILHNYNDSIDVKWDETEGIKTIKVTEYTQGKCVATPILGHVMIASAKVDIGNLIEICQGETYTFKPTQAFSQYQWNTGSTGTSLEVNQPGTYWVEVADASGCRGRDSAVLVVNPLLSISLGNDTVLCPEEEPKPLILDAGYTGSQYVWSTGDILPTIEVSYGKQTIWVDVTSDKGCTTRDTIEIAACNYNEWVKTLDLPNAFTPNEDNDNDTWKLWWIHQFDGATVEIFDRWGRMVYQTKSFPSDGWNGISNGKPLPMDSYYYIVNLQNGTDPIVGNVTVIR